MTPTNGFPIELPEPPQRVKAELLFAGMNYLRHNHNSFTYSGTRLVLSHEMACLHSSQGSRVPQGGY